jgi:urease accessory protein UreH
MNGSLALACSWREGRSRLTTLRFEGVARASRPLRADAGAVHVIASALGPGLLAGDHVSRDVDVAMGATLVVSGQMATPVFAGASPSSSVARTQVAKGAAFVAPSQPLLLAPGALHESVNELEVSADGLAFVAEIVVLGRDARLRSRTAARIDGRLAVRDACDLAGDGSQHALLTAIVVTADADRRMAISRSLEALLGAEPAIRGGLGATDGATILRARSQGAWLLQSLLDRFISAPALRA